MTNETIATVVVAAPVVATVAPAAEKPAKAHKAPKAKPSLIRDGELDLTACALATLTRAKEGDHLLFIGEDASLRLMEVCVRIGSVGRTGGTLIDLKDIITNEVVEVMGLKSLPAGVLDVRRVGKPVNARTLRKLDAEHDAAPVAAEPAAEPAVAVEAAPMADVSADVVVEAASDDVSVELVADATADEDVSALLAEIAAEQPSAQ